MKPDWRYLAGLWDGEGCVTAVAQKRKRRDGTVKTYYQFRMILTNTSKKLIYSLVDEYGGSVYFNASELNRRLLLIDKMRGLEGRRQKARVL